MKTLVLDATTKTIAVKMSGAATTTNPDWTSHWADDNGTSLVEGSLDGALNGTSNVTVVSAPASSTRRVIKSITIQNRDSAAVTLTIQLNDNGTFRNMAVVTLQVNDTWTMEGQYDTNGNFKTILTNQNITLSGDVTGTGSTAITTTLATVNANVGSFGSATASPTFTVNAKGLTTAAANVTITPAVGSITGLGTGIATFLATPSSANLATAMTDETGTGSLVFNNKPTFLGTIQTRTAMGAQAINGSLGNMFSRILAGNETFTQSNISVGQNIIVEVTNAAGGGDTVTWFSGITWVTSGAAAPVQAAGASAITTYGFTCTATNTFLGYLVGTQ